ncbi:BZ3500_MvSof-1268-A1-R1_Chr2-1g04181 [Microbotryum saponariae]|uniref:Vacuolar fusion protein MON1 n=1 Tax=Microbotryum saponariae TaxID=289078 RepID=A0A2X0KHR3_9BASI|nr:BZ3500_MvSof-1268-A1-R1_Chr2-1g04181 [Microbotryum saponariae]SCZ91168.1 BZ3501_MvSof-1269-A2-R1_Chr2-1g03837 [Microbotryum saponariae]
MGPPPASAATPSDPGSSLSSLDGHATSTSTPTLPRLMRGLTDSSPRRERTTIASTSTSTSSNWVEAITSAASGKDTNNRRKLRRVKSSFLTTTPTTTTTATTTTTTTTTTALGDIIPSIHVDQGPRPEEEDGYQEGDSDSSGFANILSRVKGVSTQQRTKREPDGLTPHATPSRHRRIVSAPVHRTGAHRADDTDDDEEGQNAHDDSDTGGWGVPTQQTIQAARLAAENSRRSEEEQRLAVADDDDDGDSQQDGNRSDIEDEDRHSKNSVFSEDDDDDEEGQLVTRAQGHTDPREMLRAQLRRNETGPSTTVRRNRSERTESDKASTEQEAIELTPRRYFILSSAGKLIFTTDLDDEEATGYVGVMQAIISIFADEGDKLRYVDAGKMKIAFVLKAPLYLVCISDWGEPEFVLRTHLDYLYLQVLSIVTYSQLSGIFSKRSNFDLRRLMQGTEPFFHHLVKTLQTSFAILTSSLEVYRIDQGTREEVAKALLPSKHKPQAQSLGLLYAFVISSGRIVTLLRPTRHTIHPTDLHLLLSTISSSTTFQAPDSESWIPVCLPRFNNKGFLHAYISYLTQDTGIVLVSAERDGFEGVKAWGEEVKRTLKAKKLLDKIEEPKVQRLQEYSLMDLAVPGLRHFLYKARAYVQITNPVWEGEYETSRNRVRLITLYQRLYEALHVRPAYAGGVHRPPAKLMYLRTEHEAVLGWVSRWWGPTFSSHNSFLTRASFLPQTTSSFELYLAVSPLLPKTAVVSAARAVIKWIKAEENRLFLTSAPSF